MNLSKRKKIIWAIIVTFAILIIWQYELIIYGLGQARGQVKVIWNAQPIEEILENPQVADSLKQKIRLTQEIREFAIDSLGVSDSESYKSVYDQKGKPVLWVVTACEPFSLEDKKWHFPLLGSVSYKGFFEYDQALKEKGIWDAEGYDTGIRTVSAWSTLGILDDPIMSELLFRSEGELANTIIHELTHATLFVKNDLKFNENLASFIGNEGAEAFLQHKYGKNSAAYRQYQDDQYDRRLFSEHMLNGVQRLDSLYSSFTSGMLKEKKQILKENEIRSILTSAQQLDFKSQKYHKFLKKLLQQDALPNNTFFKSYVRYQASLSSMEKEYEKQFNGDIRAYLIYLKQKYGT